MTSPHLDGDVEQHKQHGTGCTYEDHLDPLEPGVAGLKLQLDLAVPFRTDFLMRV